MNMSNFLSLSSTRSLLVRSGCLGRLWDPVSDTIFTQGGVQGVRWRKARWMPTAKSKMFKIPVKKLLPPDEAEEMKRLHNIYRTRMKSIRKHLIEENKRALATSELALQQAEKEEEEHQRLLEYNDQENLRVAALREQRVQKEFEANIARIEVSKEKFAQQQKEAEEEALRIIAETQELVKTFIKREDLEAAIETALANPLDYNFGLDTDGTILPGRITTPPDHQDPQKLSSTAAN